MEIIRVSELGIGATSLIVDGKVVHLIEIDEETRIEGEHGNLDIINSLANFILQNGINYKQLMSEKEKEQFDVTGNCYLIRDASKLGMYHKYAKIQVIFDLVVHNHKILLKRVS